MDSGPSGFSARACAHGGPAAGTAALTDSRNRRHLNESRRVYHTVDRNLIAGLTIQAGTSDLDTYIRYFVVKEVLAV